ncbi:hypothetical protein R1flu_004191 [Riccia fluitans]|uniref:Uncharacterized protein n=1 Tax=Riccia fluitans TaxID=41844 RepID=A0ABD1YSM1_9MARC
MDCGLMETEAVTSRNGLMRERVKQRRRCNARTWKWQGHGNDEEGNGKGRLSETREHANGISTWSRGDMSARVETEIGKT